MTKVFSRKNITFPKLRWGIQRSEIKELPSNKVAQEIILNSIYITKVASSAPKKAQSNPKPDKPDTDD